MTRWFAGTFDPGRCEVSPRLSRALLPHTSTLLSQGALQIAYTGAPSTARVPVCLLDGFLDNASELSVDLEMPDETPPEELLGAGWRRWGPGLLARMRGDFALVIWDGERREGLIARDQLGLRSIFVHDAGDGLHFAGEIRFLLALLARRPVPDPVSVAHWITMGHRPGSATLYEGIRRVNPGALLLLDHHGVREQCYWAPRFDEPLDASGPELAVQLRVALARSIERRIAADGGTGVLMSGGLDSASVAAIASSQAPGALSAYSAVFPEHPAVDESALIAELRQALGLGGVTAEVRAGGLLASALESTKEWELPLRSWGDFWALPLLRAAASAGVRVTLGGDGGDELFGARAYLLADRLRAGHPLESLALARELPGAGDHPARRDIARIVAGVSVVGALPYSLHRLLRGPFARRETPRWLLPAAARDLLASADPMAWKRLDGPRWWAEVAHGLTRGVEEIGVFEHQRRRAASAGLEARHPLFDLDLVELGLRQPPLATFDRYRSRPVLRAVMGGLLPDTVRLRPQKALFDSVLVDCLDGADGAAVRRLLSDPRAELRAYVDHDALTYTLFEDPSFRRAQPFGWTWQLWRLTTAECWLRLQDGTGRGVLGAGLDASGPRLALRTVDPKAKEFA